MRPTRIAVLAILLLQSLTAAAFAADFTVGPQYDTTHVYVAPADFNRFVASFVSTLGGTTSKQGVFQVTPTPSQTMSQLALTPAGTISVFGFKTPLPAPFGTERTGYLVTDFDAAVQAARAAGAEVIVAPFPDPIGRDAVIAWPGGVNMQLYWHTAAPSYAALTTVPENRVYVSPDRADAFVRDFVTFSHGKIVSDDGKANGAEIGRPGDTFRRIRITSGFGKMAVLVTDGHLPYPFGHEVTGYEVADLNAVLTKANAAGVVVLAQPVASGGRTSAIVQFPGGYIAEIHQVTDGQHADVSVLVHTADATSSIDHADIDRWAAAWNSHDIKTVMALFTPNVIIHQPSNPKPLDSAGVRGFFSMIFKAYPDFHVDVTEALVDGQNGASVERVTGTWSGPYTDPATGKTAPGNNRKFDHPGVMLLTYAPDHKINRVDILWDRLTVDQQLGLTPQ